MKAGTRVLLSLSLCVVMAAMTASLTTHAAAKAATVVTDLSDYPPGTQVNVSGTGWLAGEVVQLTFTETSTTPPGGYTDGPFVFYATADGLGNIANGEFYVDLHRIIHTNLDPFPHGLLEAGQLGLQRVGAGQQIRQREVTGGVALRHGYHTGRDVVRAYAGVRHDCAGRIGYAPQNGAARLLSGNRAGQ